MTSSNNHSASRTDWWLFLSLYTTQTIGISFFVVTLVAILRSRGVAFDTLSTIYMLGMVWPFKFLWANWVDRISFGRLGHFRGWMILMQTGMLLVFFAMMFFDAVDDFGIVYFLCLLMAFFSATQDIAVDATACTKFSWSQRGIGNGVQVSGGLLGNLIGAGFVLVIYSWIGWIGSLTVLMCVTAIALVQLLFYRENTQKVMRQPRWMMINQFRSLWKRPGGKLWLAILLIFPIGSSLAYALITPILVDEGWGLDRIGLLVNMFGSALGVLSALTTGWLITRMSRKRVLVVSGFIQLIGILAIVLPVFGYTDSVSVTLAIGLYFICYNPAATILATLMMDQISGQAPGSEYTLQYSLKMFFSMGMISVGTAMLGPYGYQGVLLLSFAVGVFACGLSWLYRETETSDVAYEKLCAE
ncbi:MFS transporter [Vibrio mangrovi]|uniref:MFS transporter n=1 Tax=Vibrio mangrovi TaxID=474394 RepID=A0A1Y6IX71_9VIBR|nr:MFS transporter [Vibrio mangrovi]MDW6002265.1 MFS transporter [Vibrio mangrovi]SMS01611.1 muropeptide transporter [Vibrio mangrovi]